MSKHSRVIATGFTLVLLLMLILFIFGFTQIKIMNQQTETITFQHNVKSDLMIEMRKAVFNRQVQLRNIILEQDIFARDEALLVFNQLSVPFVESRRKFESMQMSPEEQLLLEEIHQQTIATFEAQIQLIERSIHDTDNKITSTDLATVFKRQNGLISLLEEMIQIQNSKTSEAVMDSQRSYQHTRNAILFFGTAAILLGIVVAVYIVRLTDSQEKSVLEGMMNLAEANDRLEERVKQRTSELAEARDRALASNRAKDAFLANMSHELRTPLNVIIGYSELVAEMLKEDGINQYSKDINKIHAAAMHQLSLINSLLDISKIEEGKLEMHPVDFDVEGLVSEVEASVMPLMSRNNNKFNIDCSYGLGMMYSDNIRIKQILLNLLSNAAKFTKDGKVNLDINRDSDNDEINFSITDTGIGIPEDYMEKMFDKFSQQDSSTTRQFGGTGLGLSISKQLSLQLNGDIKVRSKEGEGSTFTLTLPTVYAA